MAANFLTDLDHLLAANGVDPVFNMVLGDHDMDDGTSRGILQLIVSQNAAKILATKTPIRRTNPHG